MVSTFFLLLNKFVHSKHICPVSPWFERKKNHGKSDFGIIIYALLETDQNCTDSTGQVRQNGDVFKSDKCTVCLCSNGEITCDTLQCKPLDCPLEDQYQPEHECCPKCRKCM